MTQDCIDTRSRAGAAFAPLLWGAAGVVAFSLTFPATRLAVAELDGALVGLGRGVVAGMLALTALVATRQRLPPRRLWRPLAITALGVVFGFPVLSAWALASVPAAHGAVVAGLLPAATAVMAALRAGERPSWSFWLAALLGLLAVLGFAVAQGAGRPQRPQLADLLILAAIVLGGLGYAEGGRLARELGGWQVISWALVLSLPLLLPLTALRAVETGVAAGAAAWLGFAYVAVISMYVGFFAWYRALALGGVARIAQLQLAQPLLTMLWSALLLSERVSLAMLAAAAAVLACVALTQRARIVAAPIE
jgi:drug/metabolite transporter (DMT)-like permease